jgi:LPS-assembly protein
VYDREFVTGNFNVGLWNNRGDRLFVEYRYDRAVTDSIYTRAQVEATPNLAAYGTYERNLKDDTDLRREIGVLVKRQCWSFDIRYTDEIFNRSITFQINLNGLGGLGTGFDPTALSGNP